ncbi:MAG: tyrosine protein phosphatase [Candidatus Omnitrophica bacterium]|nr:tyrosine protein phosphatase [Candidatus Omnitrophota bacterium]
MIDIHSHIIPGIDDGAQSWEEAHRICEMAFEDGTQVIVATPHAYNGMYGHEGQDIHEAVGKLNQELRDRNIDLEVIPGAEVHARPDLVDILRQNPALTLNASRRYFLLEFPHAHIPRNVRQFLFDLGVGGFIPIIAHPERNLELQNDPDLVEDLVNRGSLCQITAMSVMGQFGARAEKLALELLERDCVFVVASDTHSAKSRPPYLSGAYAKIKQNYGEKKAKELFEINPRKVIEGAI